MAVTLFDHFGLDDGDIKLYRYIEPVISVDDAIDIAVP